MHSLGGEARAWECLPGFKGTPEQLSVCFSNNARVFGTISPAKTHVPPRQTGEVIAVRST